MPRLPRSPRAALLLASALAGCTAAPKPAPHAVVRAAAPPTLVVPSATPDWQDVPLTPGTWRYATDGQGSSASYGPAAAPLLVMRCDPAHQTVTLSLPAVASAGALTVRTSSSSRTLPPAQNAAGGASASLPARDFFLDEIAFSRGRFSVAAPGMATLFVPSWAEPSRVIEDCRG